MTASAPRRVRTADRFFGLARLRVLDLGCGSGSHLQYFGPGSVGLELDGASIALGRSRGLDIRPWNFEQGIPLDLEGGFDAVWASNLFEHVLSPHSFLIAVRSAIAPGGRLLLVVPVTHIMSLGPYRGYLAEDHVNFFRLRTLRLTVARAGYVVEDLISASFPSAPHWIAQALSRVSPGVLIAARPISGFQYPDKAHKRLVDGRIVFQGTLGDADG